MMPDEFLSRFNEKLKKILRVSESKWVDVKRCQRCGKDHDHLLFSPLDNAADDYKFCSICPETSQPILLRVVSDGSTA